MIARNCTVEDLEKALVLVNERYHGNVCWNRSPEVKGKTIHFTLKVRDVHSFGHSCGNTRNVNGRRKRMATACWHVHGNYFEALFSVAPNANLLSKYTGTIDRDQDNWMDWEKARGFMASEACDCDLHEDADADPVEVASSLA